MRPRTSTDLQLGRGAYMRVAFVSPGTPAASRYETGDILGIESQIWGIATNLSSRGHDIEIVRRSSHGAITHHASGVTINDMKAPGLLLDTFAMCAFSRICAKHIEADSRTVAVLSERLTSLSFGGLRNPTVFTLHLSDALLRMGREDSLKGAVSRIPKKVLESRALRSADLAVVLTPRAQSILAQIGIRSVVIPNAVNLEDMRPGAPSPFFLYAGRLVRSKGIEYLLQAAKLASGPCPELRVRIVGSGPDEVRLKKLAASLGLVGTVSFQPFANRQEYLRVLGSCAAFVSPSVQEAFPVSVIEAMASERPVIVADVMGANEIVENGKDGIVVPPGDAGELASAMQRLASEPEVGEEMGKRGREKVALLYTFSRTASAYERVCEGLVTRA